MRLTVRPLPYVGESTLSYMHRLAIRNGYADAKQLALLANDDTRCVSAGNWYEFIKSMTGHSKEHLARLPLMKFASRGAYSYEWNGIRLHRRHVIKGLNFCALCLSDAAYHRAEWQLAWMPVCEVHGCPLRLHDSDSEGVYLAHIFMTPKLPVTIHDQIFSDVDLQKVLNLQRILMQDMLSRDTDLGFSYNQACLYIDRLFDRLHKKSGNPLTGVPTLRSQETPERIIAGMLEYTL